MAPPSSSELMQLLEIELDAVAPPRRRQTRRVR
jgi:hypothetical protein